MFKKSIFCLVFVFLVSLTLFAAQPDDPSGKIQIMNKLHQKKMARQHALQEKWSSFQPTENQKNYDVTYYAMNLEVDPVAEYISGSLTIQVNSLIEGLSSLEIDLWDNFTVDSITSNNELLQFTHANNLITTDLNKSYSAQEQITLEIYYQGKPVDYWDLGAFLFGSHGDNKPVIITSCEGFGASSWWPCKDHPGDKPDSMDINITVPSDLVVASNGQLRNVIEIGAKKTYYWHVSYPIVIYNPSLNISDYEVFHQYYNYGGEDTLRLDYYIYPEDLEKAKSHFEQTIGILSYFSEKFGEYPFVKDKYGIAEVCYFGMEHQTMIAYGSGFTNDSFNNYFDYLLLHDTAHEWFGNMISLKEWGHAWLNEGFATYAEALYTEDIFSKEDYKLYMDYLKSGIVEPWENTLPLFCSDSTEGITPFQNNIYAKGAWVLHMLRHVVGDSLFDKILKGYCADPDVKYKNANTYDFKNICESITNMELDWFFNQWIFGIERPHYEYYWDCENIGSEYQVNLYLNQLQKNQLFKMPVDISITSASADTIFTIMVDKFSDKFQFSIHDIPEKITIDPDDWILKYVTEMQPKIQVDSYQIQDSQGNNITKFEAGTKYNLFLNLSNEGSKAENVTIKLSSSNPFVSVSTNETHLGMVEINSTASTESSPFKFEVSSDIQSNLINFDIAITADNDYTMSTSFFTGKILLIDDDNKDAYETYFISIFDGMNIQYDIRQSSAVNLDSLSQYDNILWFTGDAQDSTLTSDEQMIISHILDSGLNLILTGQNIGYDLVKNGSANDSTFYHNYLHAHFIEDHANSNMIIGNPALSEMRGFVINFNGTAGGAGNQTSQDVISPTDDAMVILKYTPAMNCAGLQFINPNTGSHLVYLPFGIEGIAGPYNNSAINLVKKCIFWISGITRIDESINSNNIPTAFQLEQNYPNPFNAHTQIRYSLPKTCHTKINLFNMLGQKICTLVDAKQSTGNHMITWKGTDELGNKVSSGIYFYELEADGFKQTKKMILLY